MLDPEKKAKWLAALRSGNFKQAYNFLYDKTGGYCCIGVYMQEVKGYKRHASDSDDCFPQLSQEYPTESSTCTPSWISCMEDEGISKDQTHNLAHMNDNGKSFAEIADYIEENL